MSGVCEVGPRRVANILKALYVLWCVFLVIVYIFLFLFFGYKWFRVDISNFWSFPSHFH